MDSTPKLISPIVCAILVVMLGLAIRIAAAVRSDSLWEDEANDAFVCHNSANLGQLVDNLRAESSPPLHYLMEWPLYRVFFPNTAPVKAMVVVLGTAAVALILATAWKTIDPWTGVLSGLIVATAPYFVRYSIELRNYALFAATASAYGLAMALLLRKPTVARTILAGACGGVMLLSHYYGLYLVAMASLLAGIALWRSRRVGRVVLAGAISAAFFAPWAPIFFAQLHGDLQPWSKANQNPVEILQVLRLPLGTPWIAGIIAVLGLILLIRRKTRLPRPAVVIALTAFLAAALAWIVQLRSGAWNERYLIGAALWITPALAWCIISAARMAPAKLRAPAIMALLAAVGYGQYTSAAHWLTIHSPAPQMAQIIEEHGKPGDLIVILPCERAPAFNFYYHGNAREWAPPFAYRVENIPWSGLAEKLHGLAMRAGLIRDVSNQLRHGGRVWLVTTHELPPDGNAAWIDEALKTHPARLYEAHLLVLKDILPVLYSRGARITPYNPPYAKERYSEMMRVVLFEPQAE